MLIEWLRETEAKLRERAVRQQRVSARCFEWGEPPGAQRGARPRRVLAEQSVRASSAAFARQYTEEWERAYTALREAEAILDAVWCCPENHGDDVELAVHQHLGLA